MNILHFSTYDIVGGAAKAAYRMHTALRDAGHSSQMFVRYKQSDDDDVQVIEPVSAWWSRYNRLMRKIPLPGASLPKADFDFNFDTDSDIKIRSVFSNRKDAVDIINLYWITNSLTTKAIKEIYEYYRCPLVWILVDMEPLTGGCHYSYGCKRFREQCGSCPLLSTRHPNDYSHRVWCRKHKYLKGLPITFVAPSSWLSAQLKESYLFGEHPAEFIPIAIDTKVFHPFDKRIARRLLDIPSDKKVIFFGAYSIKNPQKGMSFLKEALYQFESLIARADSNLDKEDIFLLVAGSKDKEFLESLPFPYKKLGVLRDDISLALAYQSADLFVCSSVEDAGPMMIPDAMLCGTPVAAFNTGCAPDLIETMKTGYLANYKDSADLAKGIYTLLSANNLAAISNAAHEAAVGKHSPAVVTAQYLDLYERLKQKC